MAFLGFFGRLAVAILGGVIAAGAYEALKKPKIRDKRVIILICIIAAGLILFFLPIAKPEGTKIKLDKQWEKTDDTLIFTGTILDYNPYRIITYLEKFSDPGRLCRFFPDQTTTKWRIGTEGSWTIKITQITDMMTVYFFLVRERYPAPDHASSPKEIICVDWTKWGPGK